MIANDNEALGALIRKLERLANLNDDDRKAIASLPHTRRSVRAGHYLVREGQEISECCLLAEGYACRNKMTQDGGRQIVSFHMRGDLLDLQHLLLARADHNVQTITEATVACIPAAEIKRIARDRPNVGDALWRDTLIDASVFREWVLNVGRRDARTRIAHMLCEFVARGRAAGLGSPNSFELPMTQEQIADATGLTQVHVNRMMRILTEQGVLARDRREVQVVDWNLMRSIAGFDDHYLHAAA